MRRAPFQLFSSSDCCNRSINWGVCFREFLTITFPRPRSEPSCRFTCQSTVPWGRTEIIIEKKCEELVFNIIALLLLLLYWHYNLTIWLSEWMLCENREYLHCVSLFTYSLAHTHARRLHSLYFRNHRHHVVWFNSSPLNMPKKRIPRYIKFGRSFLLAERRNRRPASSPRQNQMLLFTCLRCACYVIRLHCSRSAHGAGRSAMSSSPCSRQSTHSKCQHELAQNSRAAIRFGRRSVCVCVESKHKIAVHIAHMIA